VSAGSNNGTMPNGTLHMSRYRQTWPLDDPISEDGDNGFLGFNSRENPETIPAGTLSYAQNMRFDRGIAAVRKGTRRLKPTTGTVIYDSCSYYDQDVTTNAEHIALVRDTSVDLWRIGTTTGTIANNLGFEVDTSGLTETAATALVDGLNYIIETVGDSDFTAVGASANTVGTIFTATGPASGTGICQQGTLASETIASTDKIEIIQLFKKLFIYRGLDKTALQWNGDTSRGFYAISPATLNWKLDQPIYDDPLYVPKAEFAIAAFNRIIAPSARDQVGFSDTLDPFTFNLRNDFYVNQGDADYITALAAYSEGQLIVFKRRSIHLITHIYTLYTPTSGDTPVSVVYEVTRQLGCVSRGSVANVGDQIFFLSDNGVHGLTSGINAAAGTGTPVALLKTRNDPLSAPINDIIERIDFENAKDVAVGIYFNNRYYLAVPYIVDDATEQTRNNRLLIYNTLNTQWESVDIYPSGVYFDNLLINTYNQTQRLFATSQESEIFLLEEEESDFDNSNTSNEIPSQITTRRYTLQTSDIKRWHYGIANWENTAAGDKVSIAVNTTNPDSTETIVSEQTAAAPEDLTKRFSLGRKRGYGIALDLTTQAGRPIIRSLGVAGRINLRSTQEVT
jgi:hypothetical protein